MEVMVTAIMAMQMIPINKQPIPFITIVLMSVTASNYIECQQLDQENDVDDDYQPLYYAGISCSSDGNKIKIGVYNDEDCAYIDSNLYVNDYLNRFKLSHALLKDVYSGTKIACISYDEDGKVEENEACANLYEAAAACKTDKGFADNANADGN